jgi:cell division protein FtsQ
MKIVKPLLLIFLSLFAIIVVVIAVVKMQHRICDKIEIVIHSEMKGLTVTQEEVLAILKKNKIKIVGEELREIDQKAIFEKLKAHPYIKQINPIRFSGQKLIIDIELRKVLLHVYPMVGQQYFIDQDGFLLPYNQNVRDRLLIANGYLQAGYRAGTIVRNTDSMLVALYDIAKTIDTSDYYRAQYKQLYVNQENNIELIPTVGSQIILLGKENNVGEKLFQLTEAYRQGLVYMNPDRYSLLDLRYKNRIIAKKRIN